MEGDEPVNRLQLMLGLPAVNRYMQGLKYYLCCSVGNIKEKL